MTMFMGGVLIAFAVLIVTVALASCIDTYLGDDE